MTNGDGCELTQVCIIYEEFVLGAPVDTANVLHSFTTTDTLPIVQTVEFPPERRGAASKGISRL